MSDKTSSRYEKIESLVIQASWLAGLALGGWVYVWARTSLIQDGNEKGIRNPLFETIWPAILGFFAAAAFIWAVSAIADEISKRRGQK